MDRQHPPVHAPLDEATHAARAAIEQPREYGLRHWSGWILGLGLLVLTLLVDPPEGLSLAGWRTAGIAALMAVWWMTEAVPIPVTALLPLVLLPALQLGDVRDAAAPYANPLIFLFFGGFIIALAMQRWNLHRRVAVNLIAALGTQPRRIVGGFLLSSALISMWVSNTATALMMLPIALSVVQLIPADLRTSPALRALPIALMLAVAYGATTGGMATLIGTPPNALLAGFMDDVYGIRIGFGQWMLLGTPVTLVALPVVYLVLTRVAFRLGSAEIPGLRELLDHERTALGRFSRGELAVTIVFSLTALAWILQPLIARALPLATDTMIAMTGAILLFLIPLNLCKGEFVMDWESAKGVPWDVLLLFGGGLSLAGAIERHGVSKYLGQLSQSLDAVPVIAAVAIICFGILMLTELTSNTATAAAFLPVAAAVGISMGESPLLFVIPTALAANCAYMLPVGTPPNAIVFGSGLVRLPEMARAGLLLNLALVPIIVGLLWLLGSVVFGIDLGVLPEWSQR